MIIIRLPPPDKYSCCLWSVHIIKVGFAGDHYYRVSVPLPNRCSCCLWSVNTVKVGFTDDNCYRVSASVCLCQTDAAVVYGV